MSSARPYADGCSYQEKLRQSVGPGMYMLMTPDNDDSVCARDAPHDPYMRYQAWGRGTCAPGAPVDDGSELLGLNYKMSKCSANLYGPGKYAQKGACAGGARVADQRACAAPTEDTRLSNPPCTLRGTGWNRWEWLCHDPQERALVPFEWNTSYRIVVKDNHKPLIEAPMDQSAFIPKGGPALDLPPIVPGPGAAAPGNPFAPSMASCADVRKTNP